MEFWVPLVLVPLLLLAVRPTVRRSEGKDAEARLVLSMSGPPEAWKRMY